MPELAKMVEESMQVYNRLRELQQTFEETTDPYRNQSFRTDVLVAFSHAFDLAYDLNRLWSKLADVPHRAEGEFDPVGMRPLHEGRCETCGQVHMLVGGQCETCIRLGMIE